MNISDEAFEKLRSKTVIQENGCHLWTGYTQKNGYGFVNISYSKYPAHRLALIMAGVDIPNGFDVCHKCDVRNCVNPEHLYAGTRKRNMKDCTDRGRHNKPKGELHWRSKLSCLDVKIMRSFRDKGYKVEILSEIFSVNNGTVSRICRREWRKEVL